MTTFILLVMLLAATPLQQETEQVQDIPELDADEVRQVLMFEIEGLSDDELLIERIEHLHDQAKAYVVLSGRALIIRFRCRQSDFGPRWGLESDYANSVIERTTERPQQTAAHAEERRETAEPDVAQEEPEVSPVMGSDDYRDFLIDFVTAIRKNEAGSFEKFYFREGDFDLSATEENPVDALARLQRERRSFVGRCNELGSALSAYSSFEIEEIVATGITVAMMNDLQVLMPRVRAFYNAAVITVLLGGRRGSITLEGVALLDDGWRVGAVAGFDLPAQQ
ncbi:MAG TPA: hypothetical protein VMX35_09795 [Acidobacteriota bacterium]|nr:hypothetical protein [Acidobacteriota bacterium]